MMKRDTKLKFGYGPYRARDCSGALYGEDGPIWTFDEWELPAVIAGRADALHRR